MNVTVEQAERIADHPGTQIGVERKRITVDGLWIQGRIGAGRQRDLRKLFAGRAVALEMLAGEHRKRFWPGSGAEWGYPLTRPAHACGRDGGLFGITAFRTLGDRAVDKHMARQPTRNCEACIDNRSQVSRSLKTSH